MGYGSPTDLRVFSDKLGSGQLAEVYRGEHLGRQVAVKFILEQDSMRNSVVEHATALAKVKSANVVTVFTVEHRVPHPQSKNELSVIVMECLDESLEDRLKKDLFEVEEARQVIRGIADGLAALHDTGIAHEDLHVGNILFLDATPKIIDAFCRQTFFSRSTVTKEYRIRKDCRDFDTIVREILRKTNGGTELCKRYREKLQTGEDLEEVVECAMAALENGATERAFLQGWKTINDRTNYSVSFFDDRFSETFPGVRGFRVFEQSVANSRLEALFKNPIGYLDGRGNAQYPIWEWRGYGGRDIQHAHSLEEDIWLLNRQEMRVQRVVAFNLRAYYRKFVYVECAAMAPCGAYVWSEEELQRMKQERGFADEEYGRFGAYAITAEELHDGAAEINGEVVQTLGVAEGRIRYLTPYNFMIAPQGSPVNCSEFCVKSGDVFNGLLEGRLDFGDLARYLETLPKREHDPF